MALTEADNQYSLYLTSPEHQDKNHYFIFVHYHNFEDISLLPEIFVVPATEISELVKDRSGVKNVSVKDLQDRYSNLEESLKVFY